MKTPPKIYRVFTGNKSGLLSMECTPSEFSDEMGYTAVDRKVIAVMKVGETVTGLGGYSGRIQRIK